jgi:single-strand DNA-binding protein
MTSRFEGIKRHPLSLLFFASRRKTDRHLPSIVVKTALRQQSGKTAPGSTQDERRSEMTGFNRVVLMGNLTRDPEVRHIPSGTPVADLGLATNEVFKNSAGEQVERTCFVDIVTWGRQAETCGQYLSKGAPVLVEGRLQLDQWQTGEGERRSRLRVRADRVKFLPRARRSQDREAPASPVKAEEEAMPF